MSFLPQTSLSIVAIDFVEQLVVVKEAGLGGKISPGLGSGVVVLKAQLAMLTELLPSYLVVGDRHGVMDQVANNA